jgi:hypothetical protein
MEYYWRFMDFVTHKLCIKVVRLGFVGFVI